MILALSLLALPSGANMIHYINSCFPTLHVQNISLEPLPLHHTTPHHTTPHNTTQHNTTQHNTTQHNTTQHTTPSCPPPSPSRILKPSTPPFPQHNFSFPFQLLRSVLSVLLHPCSYIYIFFFSLSLSLSLSFSLIPSFVSLSHCLTSVIVPHCFLPCSFPSLPQPAIVWAWDGRLSRKGSGLSYASRSGRGSVS